MVPLPELKAPQSAPAVKERMLSCSREERRRALEELESNPRAALNLVVSFPLHKHTRAA